MWLLHSISCLDVLLSGGFFSRAFHVQLVSCSGNPGLVTGVHKVRFPLVLGTIQ